MGISLILVKISDNLIYLFIDKSIPRGLFKAKIWLIFKCLIKIIIIFQCFFEFFQ